MKCKECEFEPGHGGIDPCIQPIVEALGNADIKTVASCCGHGQAPGVVSLEDGRELIVARNYQEARNIGKMFRNIDGTRPELDGPISPGDRVDRLFDKNEFPTYSEVEEVIWDAEFDAVNFKAVVVARHGL